ncbi:hypothetical protein Sste5346_007313 [Sporothrix stenoceras]|uniref:Uncharacterized protein n=1 Tax=Sporothrix stenoceras TaxID=5173 RepID=A0ABR3YUA4_9PEZI
MSSLMEIYEGLTSVVPIGEVGSADFSMKPAIGMGALNGGTLVVVACPTRAIMAHIPHLPPSPSEAVISNSLTALQQTMNEVGAFFASLQAENILNFREKETKTMVLAAEDCNEELQETHHVIKAVSELRSLGLAPVIHPYPLEDNNSSSTSVMLINTDFGQCQEMPKLHLDDEFVE